MILSTQKSLAVPLILFNNRNKSSHLTGHCHVPGTLLNALYVSTQCSQPPYEVRPVLPLAIRKQVEKVTCLSPQVERTESGFELRQRSARTRTCVCVSSEYDLVRPRQNRRNQREGNRCKHHLVVFLTSHFLTGVALCTRQALWYFIFP